MKTKTKRRLLLAVALLAWVALVAFEVGASFGFGATGVLGLVLVGALLGFFVAVLVGLASKRWRSALYFGIALFIVFSSAWTARFISAHQRKASIVAAQPIITAAERFYSAQGTYPKSFDDLIPEYLPSEPRTKMGFRGTPFTFSGDPNRNRFYITFALPAWMVCTYNSESKQWVVDD